MLLLVITSVSVVLTTTAILPLVAYNLLTAMFYTVVPLINALCGGSVSCGVLTKLYRIHVRLMQL